MLIASLEFTGKYLHALIRRRYIITRMVVYTLRNALGFDFFSRITSLRSSYTQVIIDTRTHLSRHILTDPI